MSTLTLPGHVDSKLFTRRLAQLRQFARIREDQSNQTIIIIVAGSDGNSSAGSHALLKYLLFGCSPLDVVSSDFDDAFDEMVVGVHENGIRILCPPHARHAIERVTRDTRGVEIMARAMPTEPDAEPEADEDELFKIHGFIWLTSGFSRVLVPTTSTVDQTRADQQVREEVEQWPLVQAYGLDELGAHGFFTLSHSVSALAITRFESLNQVDAAYILHVLANRLPILTEHVRATLSQLLQSSLTPDASAFGLTVKDLNQDLRAFWEYGVDSLTDEYRQTRSATHTGVRFFGPTGGVPFESNATVKSTGAKHYSALAGYCSKLLASQSYLPIASMAPFISSHAHSPLHCVVVATDPLSSVEVTRTVLLRQIVQDQESTLDVFDFMLPEEWKKKKKVIVEEANEHMRVERKRPGVGEESDPDQSSEEEYDESSSSSDSGASDSDDDRVGRSCSSAPRPAKVPVVQPRLKNESPGLKDALLLHAVYESLVQIAQELIQGLTRAETRGSLEFPSEATLRASVQERIAPLCRAKWILPRWQESLKSSQSNVFQSVLKEVDAFGRVREVDLRTGPHALRSDRLYSFTLRVSGLPSRELLSLTDDDVILGEVAFGDTFVYKPNAPPPTTNATPTEDAAEEQRRKDDPTYFGTGLTSSAAVNASAAASSSAAVAPAAVSVLLLTGDLPSRIILPSFMQSFDTLALQCLIGSYLHASAPSHLTPQEARTLGLVPLHAAMGRVMVQGGEPKIGSNLLAAPTPNGGITLHKPHAFQPSVHLAQRYSSSLRRLLFSPSDSFLSSSHLSLPCVLLLSSPSTPVLTGHILMFEKGFIFHSTSEGSFAVEFKRHVLETCWYDGASEEFGATNNSDDDDDEFDEDEAGAYPDSDDDDGDGLFTIDILAPTDADASTTPYPFLRSLDFATPSSLSRLAPTNDGVPPAKSKFAHSFFSLGLLFPKHSAFRRLWFSKVQPVWSRALEELNIHNDTGDEIPNFARHAYQQMQEAHACQRAHKRAKEEQQHQAINTSLVLPDATCDFLADARLQEQLVDAPHVDAHTLLSSYVAPKSRPSATIASSSGVPVLIPVSLVVGVPGSSSHSGVSLAVRDSSSKAGSLTRWLEVTLVSDPDTINVQKATQDISCAIAGLKDQEQIPGREQRMCITIATYESVVEIAALITRILTDFSSPLYRFCIGSIVTLVDSSSFFVSPHHSLVSPGVLDQLVPGWTTGCVLITPQAISGTDDEMVQAVRRRVHTLHPNMPMLVRTQGKRLAYQDLVDLLRSDRFMRPAYARRRLSAVLASGPSSSIVSRPRVVQHCFHLPGEILLDRPRFFAALTDFTRRRETYLTDGEREAESDEVRVRMDRLGEAMASASAAPSHTTVAGRITFTTSSSSLPSPWSVYGMVAFVKFADAVSNAGGVSGRFVEIRAAQGRIQTKRDNQIGDAPHTQQNRLNDDASLLSDDAEEHKSPAPVDDASFPASGRDHAIPLDQLPSEVRAHVHAHPGVLPPPPLTTANTSCILLVFGSSSLTRGEVARELLLASLPLARPYEKADSRFNTELKNQQDIIAAMK